MVLVAVKAFSLKFGLTTSKNNFGVQAGIHDRRMGEEWCIIGLGTLVVVFLVLTWEWHIKGRVKCGAFTRRGRCT